MISSIDETIGIDDHDQRIFNCRTPLFANLVTGIHSTGRYNTAFNTFTMEQQLTE
jgi:hypothetical protein